MVKILDFNCEKLLTKCCLHYFVWIFTRNMFSIKLRCNIDYLKSKTSIYFCQWLHNLWKTRTCFKEPYQPELWKTIYKNLFSLTSKILGSYMRIFIVFQAKTIDQIYCHRRDFAQKAKPEEPLLTRAYIKESTYSWNIQTVCQKKSRFASTGAGKNR